MARRSLSAKELVDRLCLRQSGLVDEVYEVAKRQIASEDKRETDLSAKAVSLLSVTGLSLTVAFTFGGVLLQRPAYITALATCPRILLVALPYALAIGSGIVASLYALLALLIRSDYRGVSERDVFGHELASADEKSADGLFVYRRFLVAHLWRIYRKNSRIHEKKARWIKRGQGFFFAFLVSLVPIGGVMTYSLSVATGARAPAAMNVAEEHKTSPQPPPPAEPKVVPPKPPPSSGPAEGRRVQTHILPDEPPPRFPGSRNPEG